MHQLVLGDLRNLNPESSHLIDTFWVLSTSRKQRSKRHKLRTGENWLLPLSPRSSDKTYEAGRGKTRVDSCGSRGARRPVPLRSLSRHQERPLARRQKRAEHKNSDRRL